MFPLSFGLGPRLENPMRDWIIAYLVLGAIALALASRLAGGNKS